MAYGTRQYRIQPGEAEDDESDIEAVDETIRLERGQNLFEIHVTRVRCLMFLSSLDGNAGSLKKCLKSLVLCL